MNLIYTRAGERMLQETETFTIDSLSAIPSVITDFEFFVAEKWKIASDRQGSTNTANIGSINYIPDMVSGNGMFSQLGENVFDDYWINYGKISATDAKSGEVRVITNLPEFLEYRGMDANLVVAKYKRQKLDTATGEGEEK